MQKQQQKDSVGTLELSPGIEIQTFLPKEHIPALRAGFALFPANPRWSALKFKAWKSGRQLRQALDRGETNVGDRNLLLVSPDRTANETASRPLSEACLGAVKRFLGQRSYAGW